VLVGSSGNSVRIGIGFDLLLVLVLTLNCAVAMAQQGDARIVAAREALRTGDRATLERLAAASEPHLLDHYVHYWLLVNRLARSDPPPTAEITAFIDRHRGSIPADRLQAYWLRRLASDQDWTGFLRVFAEHADPDAELRCLGWHARYLNGDREVLNEVAEQWKELIDSHGACDAILHATAVTGNLSEEAIWWRFRRQIDSRTPDAALTTAGWLAPGIAPSAHDIDQAIRSSAIFIDRLAPNFAVTRTGRELALAALVRLAREDALAAHARFLRINDRLSHDERSYVHVILGHHGALSRLPQAAEWYAAAGEIEMTDVQRAWHVRSALRIEDWRRVESAIGALSEREQEAPEWIYWLARAYTAHGRRDAGEALYRSIAGEPHFYGILAAEELGQQFVPPPPDETVSAEDRARAAADPGIRRALAFYRLDMPAEGVREWIRAVRNRDRAFLLAAAHLALAEGLYDRAINTAELADPRANFAIRFITPYRDVIEPQVREQGLDLAWVYGLMRQESRFIAPARSSAGAQGLMQVMPATGKWVAGRIGMRDYHPRMLTDPKTNVILGTSYMRLILGDLDNHPVLASAGYNAGPGRARRWRDVRPLDAAIFAETIPFDETRDYVKKVLANAVIYAAMFEGRPQSLRERLGVIAPATERQ
jgi:soluble lytic murein transglycosylase